MLRKIKSTEDRQLDRIRKKLLADKSLREYILKRDNYTCCLCHTEFTRRMENNNRHKDKVLQIHHIYSLGEMILKEPENIKDYAFNPKYQITLCKQCHKEVTGKSKSYIDYFLSVIAEREF